MRKSLYSKISAALFFAIITLTGIPCKAQITLVKNGKCIANIVISPTEENVQAANMLNRFIKEISNTKGLPVLFPFFHNAQSKTLKKEITKKNNIFIGFSPEEMGLSPNDLGEKLSEDAFAIVTKNDRLMIFSGGGKGSIYAVATLLERYLGVRYYTYETYDLPKKTNNLVLPQINLTETPAFRYRQTQSYGTEDPIFKDWFRLEEPKEEFAANYWVHTFNRILPSDVYGKAHPEWYSYIKGKRQPGNHSQWCLTNEEVFEAACSKIDSIFKAHPQMKMISVSQNDGNFTQCQCERCKAVDEYEGSPSGNLIRFMNRLAERFPDKQFSTLAYLFSMHPPKHTRPLPNVNIMLCSIDAKREVPLTDNASGRDFVKALEGWSRISNNIFVWDYGINFDNVVSPFPNFHNLQKNLQLFHRHHATMVFEQINASRGTDFGELRTYMMARLMWNPYQDADSLMRTFMEGYYGKAAPYLDQYLKIMQGALLASGKELWIYDSPITHKDGMLNAQLRKTYNELFDKAEAAVQDDEEKLKRVQMTRLTLQYSELEIARTEQNQDIEKTKKLLDLFERRTKAFNVPTLNERRNSPADYCKLYRERFLPSGQANKAANATVTFINPPAERYQKIADKALTDGLYGGTTYVESWVGWEGENADFILDLGEEKTFNHISTDFLHQLGAWILLPKGGHYSVSSDGKSFTDFGSFTFEEDRDVSVKFVKGTAKSVSPVKGRYIKVHVETLGNCPSWHFGVGYPAWFFMDEIIVQ
ncbi:MAG: DUF4838 domain-containing protein [Prevotella sp.]|nr:DUF4838 domain-containing protein [Prevotella sp.]